MKTRIIISLLTTCLFFAGINLVFSQSAEQQYQKGLMQEEGEGNLEEAIKIFAGIVENQNADQSLQAKALLHVGLCYEKLGKDEATKAYQELVNNFPSQKNEVAIARERLSKLILAVEEITKIPPTPKFTKIKIPTKLSWSVALSPDGKDLALVSDKKLWKMPLSGNLGQGIPGTPVQLNTEDIEVEWSGLSWSRDGKWIAFNENPIKDKKEQGIYVVSSKGGTPKKIIENNRDVRTVNYRISLSPDGKKLAFTSVEEKKQYIHTISVDGSNSQKLVEMQAREPVFSPDGKMIAYVEDKNTGTGIGDLGLWVVSANGGTPHLLANAGMASSPVWSSDGKLIAFLDNSVGNQINIVPVSTDEESKGNVIKIDAPEGTSEIVVLAGWSPNNKIGFLLTTKREFGLYTLPAKGGQAAIVLNNGYPSEPRWSQDSKKIYYTIEDVKSGSWEGKSLSVVSANGGNGRKLPVNEGVKIITPYMYQSGNRISPDGKMIISAATSKKTVSNKYPETQIWKIPIDGTKPVQVTNPDSLYGDFAPCWSPDGEKIAFLRVPLKTFTGNNSDETSLYTINSKGGNPDLVIKDHKNMWSPLWSPDGKMIAFVSYCENDGSNINVVDVENGKSMLVAEIPSVHVHIELAWSPDSKRIAFNDDEGKVVKVISISDGSIENIKTNLVDVIIYHLDWSPDGERFVFVGMKGGNREFWFMEDFLPLEKLAQNEETEAAKEPEGIVIKQLPDILREVGFGSPSPDANFFSYMDGETGNLAIRDVNTEKTQIVTTKGTWDPPMQFANFSKISPDNKWVAYSWQYVDKGNKFDLRVLNIDNPSPRILYDMKDGEVHPAFWLSDNKRLIAYTINTQNSTYQIISVNTDDGSFNVLNTSKKLNGIPGLCLSSDEKYIAFDFLNGGNKNFDIYSVPVEGGPEVPLVEHPANDRTLGWLPGRKELLFLSDRSGTWDIWSLPVAKGKSNGQPKLIFSDAGEIKPVGITRDGTLYFSRFGRKFTITISPFDISEGKIKKESGMPLLGSNYDAEWSPDGQSIAYNKEIMEIVGNSTKLYVFDLNTGKERPIAENLEVMHHASWSPKENKILAIGRDNRKTSDKNYAGGIYNIDVKTGKETELLSFTRDSFKDLRQALNMAVEWSMDAKSIFYIKENLIIQRDLETGQQKTFYQSQNSLKYLKRFSHGNDLVFMDGKQIMKASGENGDIKKLCSLEDNQRIGIISWSPDGNYIYLSVDEWLCKLPSDGGTIQKVCPLGKETRFVSFHPEGKKIAITRYDQKSGFLVMENLVKKVEKIYSQNE